jgi:two-component system response regulator AtoC
MTATILIVDDEENAQHNLCAFLEPKGFEIITAATLTEARACLQRGEPDIVLLDVQLPDGYGPDLLEETIKLPMRPPIILITAYGEIEMAVEAMKNGAKEIVAMRMELNHIRQSQQAQINFVPGNSPQMRGMLQAMQRASQASVSVLITGETGTGKEVVARAIHLGGPRSSKPFVAINCAAIQSTMLESELFGYEAGAFTGAQKRKHGLMEIADEGVLFLDEISSMPVDMQAKLLRAIEERAIRRVGGTTLIKIDVQILAASNRDLPTLIKDGKFREDLYYRLKVVDLHMPPLRDRKEDIPELVGLFIRESNPKMGLNIQDITPRAMEALCAHPWPGNIRELRNVIDRAMLFCDEAAIDLPHLPPEFHFKP